MIRFNNSNNGNNDSDENVQMQENHHHHSSGALATTEDSPRHFQMFSSMADHNMAVGGDALAQHSDKFVDAPYKANNTNDKLAYEVRKILGITPPLSVSTLPSSSSLTLNSGNTSSSVDRPRPSSSHGGLIFNYHYDHPSNKIPSKVVTNSAKKKEFPINKSSSTQQHTITGTKTSNSILVEEINIESIFKVIYL